MAERLTLARTKELRRTRGATALLYLTDRCPVGCAHCSVSARPDGPAPSDLPLLDALVTGLGARPGLVAVAVSGGEPFAERRALTLAVDRLTGAGKAVVVFTSGNWAVGDRIPAWILRVLGRVSCVFLGADTFHADRLGPDRLRSAIRTVAEAGGHVVLQVIDGPGRREWAGEVLRGELGADWGALADIHLTAPLRLGRGADLFEPSPPRPASAFGPCTAARAPTVRHDGTVTGCCNEAVITGRGPAALRRTATGATELTAALHDLDRDPLLRVMAAHGPGALAALPGFEHLAESTYETVCGACWAAHDAVATDARAAAVLQAVTGTGRPAPARTAGR